MAKLGSTEPVSPRTRHARELFAELPSNYDSMAGVLSFWQDPRWRRFMVSTVRVPGGARVLDVATGTGAVAMAVAARTGAHVVGLDQSEEMLGEGVSRSQRAGLGQRIRFVLGRGERLPFPSDSFDAVTFTYLLRYVDEPSATLEELARVLKPGGTMANLEFHVPGNPFWRALWLAYTRVGLPVGWRLTSDAWFRVGKFLGRSISDFYRRHPLPEQLGMWRAAGIADVRARAMSLGGGVVIWGTKSARRSQGAGSGR